MTFELLLQTPFFPSPLYSTLFTSRLTSTNLYSILKGAAKQTEPKWYLTQWTTHPLLTSNGTLTTSLMGASSLSLSWTGKSWIVEVRDKDRISLCGTAMVERTRGLRWKGTAWSPCEASWWTSPAPIKLQVLPLFSGAGTTLRLIISSFQLSL